MKYSLHCMKCDIETFDLKYYIRSSFTTTGDTAHRIRRSISLANKRLQLQEQLFEIWINIVRRYKDVYYVTFYSCCYEHEQSMMISPGSSTRSIKFCINKLWVGFCWFVCIVFNGTSAQKAISAKIRWVGAVSLTIHANENAAKL